MTTEDLLAMAAEAIALSKVQQRTYGSSRYDNGKRDPHSLYTNQVFWAYQGIICNQMGKLVDALLTTATTPEELDKRRVRFLSIVFSLIDRFTAGDGELVDTTSAVPQRGTRHGELA